MKTILFVKTSSLGDVVHNGPAVSDAARVFPGVQIDWMVEEGFAPVASMHRDVRRVIPVALRRWRGVLWDPAAWSQIGAWRRALRGERYDAIVDTQSLVKSALFARLARGTRHGMDADSAREGLAAMFYDVKHTVPRGAHAVQRNRELAAQSLGYRVEGPADYGLRAPAGEKSSHLVLLTMTSRADKLWPEAAWVELGRSLQNGNRGPVLLPWGSETERARAERIANGIGNAVVPPRMALESLARALAGASAVVGLDTGLTHLAAALGARTVGIYCGSDPALTGIYGAPRAHNLGGIGRPPSAAEVLGLLQ